MSEVKVEPTHVSDLSAEEFKKLLTLIIDCERSATNDGRLKTMTTITMSLWLEVLNRTRTVESFTERIGDRPFRWESLMELKLPIVIACCYMRIIRESHNHHGA